MRTGKLHCRADVCRFVVLLFTVTLFLASAQAGNIKTIASTIPANGDVNPYGVAVVPTTAGSLTRGNILVSNFNNSANLQGTGTTIVQISPSGTVSLFVTNVLNGTLAGGGNVVNQGTVLRLNLTIAKGSMPNLQSMTIVGSGFSERTDPAALVIGPTGVGLGRNDDQADEDEGGRTLYVADSLNNRIA